MRLFSGKIPTIAESLIRQLCAEEAIDVERDSMEEAQLDVESVLREYLRMEREIEDEARDLLSSRGMGHEGFGKAKRQVAKDRRFGLGEDAVEWISVQLLDLFMHTNNIEEIYADDLTLRKISALVLKKHMAEDADLEREVRKHLKNLEEGTVSWDAQYAKVEEKLRRVKGLL